MRTNKLLSGTYSNLLTMEIKYLYKDTYRLVNRMVTPSFGILTGKTYQIWELQRKARPLTAFSLERIKYFDFFDKDSGWITVGYYYDDQQAYKNLEFLHEFRPCIIGYNKKNNNYVVTPSIVFPEMPHLFNIEYFNLISIDLELNYTVQKQNDVPGWDKRFIYEKYGDAIVKMEELNSFEKKIVQLSI